MLSLVPENQLELIKDLKWNYDDASFKAPEENIQWERTMKTLQNHIPEPNMNWEFEVLSVFITHTVPKLKEMFRESREQHN